MQQSGLLIGIDGYDTKLLRIHARLTAEQLKSSGYTVALFDLTNTKHPAAYFRREYEHEVYTDSNLYEPYSPTNFYALHHFAFYQQIKRHLEAGGIVICIGYVLTNILIALQKAPKANGITSWIESLEYDMYSLPRPNASIALLPEDDRYLSHISTLCATPVHAITIQESITTTNSNVRSALEPYLVPIRSEKRGEVEIVEMDRDAETPGTHSVTVGSKHTVELSTAAYIELRLLAQHGGINVISRDITDDYYRPELHNQKLLEAFDNSSAKLFDAAHEASKTNETLGRVMLPLSQLNQVVFTIEEKERKHVLTVLSSHQNEELRDIAKRFGVTESSGDTGVADKFLKDHHLTPIMGREQAAELIRYHPKNELDVLTDRLYSSSTLAIEDLRNQLDGTNYEDRVDLLTQTNSQTGGVFPIYEFEFLTSVADLTTVLELEVGFVQSQELTQQYGFDSLDNGIDATVEELYENNYANSFNLYSKVQTQEPNLAVYTLLGGHKVRWLITVSWNELHTLLQALAKNTSMHKHRDAIIDMVATAHPILIEQLRTHLNTDV